MTRDRVGSRGKAGKRDDPAGKRDDPAGEREGADESLRDLLERGEFMGERRLGELIERLEAHGRIQTVSPAAGAVPAAAGRAYEPALGSVNVRGVVFDSRQVRGRSVFVAIPGAHADGHDFVAAAAELGAVVAIVDHPVAGAPLPQIVVEDTRRALATAAAWWYGDPSHALGVVGITGTDGKTTTAYMAAAVLEMAEISTGLITTSALKIGEVRSLNPEHVTTPQATDLQRALRAMVAAGNEAAVVETTSHGLALGRVAEVAYDVAIFTNLSHEHLELHGTFEAYRDAKLSLFRGLAATDPGKALSRRWPRTAIVNLDDRAAARFQAAALYAGARTITYGTSAGAAVRAVAVEEDSESLRVDVATARWHGRVTLQVAGRFNVHNALAAVALGEALDLEPDQIRAGLNGLAGVPGRMERVDCGQPFRVIVDYAHSPASLQMVLDLLDPVAARGGGALIAVFGSAGERDVQKRPMMGRIAAKRCRLVVLTDEDPRGEDGQKILDEIASGAEAAGKRRGEDLLCIGDRREAIAAAFERARTGDVVLLAGKGHEQSIIMSDGPRDWDERREAIRALESLGYRSR
ncbi:MAG TPA: UDP-N-acetylmuramoyl-L-alanyl-D-glutamate--2,6-diaminopimelate ligase [Candidatus Limnocylindrales bacterium]